MHSDYEKKKILLIDDDKDTHLIHRLILQKRGYSFLSAFSGQEGLQIAREKRPDLILLDYMMPGMDGEEVLEALWHNAKFSAIKSIPVVMLTAAMHTQELKKRLLEKGLGAYLEKPFGERELLNVIENVFVKHPQALKREAVFDELRQSRDFFEGIVQNFPGIIFTTDLDGKITYVCEGAIAHPLVNKENIYGQSIYDLCFIGDSEHRALLNALKQGKKSVTWDAVLQVGVDVQHRIPVELTSTLYRDSNAEICGILVVARDLTVQKNLEAEKLEKEKVLTVAQAMATVNHEINNPLTSIVGNIQLVMADAEVLQKSIKSRLEVIRENANRIASSVKKLTSMSRPFLKEYYNETMIFDLDNENET